MPEADVRAPSHLDPSRRRVLTVVGGTLAVLGWGLFFDQLARVGRWIFDTTYATILPTMADLNYRYRDAHNAYVRSHLYGYKHGAFTYPPITAYLFLPFHLIGLHATEIGWTIGNVVLLAVLTTLVLVRWFKVGAATAWLASGAGLAAGFVFAMYPFRSLLIWGQLALILTMCVFVDVFFVPPRYRGILTGVATAVKLLPALFLLWFLVRGERMPAVRLVATFVVLTLAAAAVWPHASAEYWFHLVPSGKDVLMVSNPLNLPTGHGQWYFGVGKVVNQSLRGMLGRPPFNLPGTMPWLLVALVVLAIGLLAMVRLLADGRDLLAFLVLSVVTVLVSPVSWVHYWVVVALAPFVAFLEWRRDRATAIAAIVLSVAMTVNLEDENLVGLYAIGKQFTNMGPAMDFLIRNVYVLAGLLFLGVVTVQVWRTSVAGRHLPLRALLSAQPTP